MDKVPSQAIYFTARLLCPLLLSQLQVQESEQRASWAQTRRRLCPMLKMHVRDRYIIPISWVGAGSHTGVGILSVTSVPTSGPEFPLSTCCFLS